jgi:hypothetical protein
LLFNHALFATTDHGSTLTVSSPTAGASISGTAVVLMFVMIAAIFVLGRSFAMLRAAAAPLLEMFAQMAKVAIMMIGVVLLLLVVVFATYAQH